VTAYLLDVNVLLALFDQNHVSHTSAHQWFQDVGRHSWASCPVTENGLVRVASHPSYPGCPGNPQEILALLRQFCSSRGHRFWPDEVSLLDEKLFSLGASVTHTHLTDVYLLGLSVHKRGKLATLDRHIPAAAVRRGGEALEVIPA
jgi:hypothetical protein